MTTRTTSKNDSPNGEPLKMEDVFERCMKLLDVPPNGTLFQESLSNDEQLQLYGLYKQVRKGNCDAAAAPSMYRLKAYYMHQAWMSRRDMPQTQAMREYVEKVVEYGQDVSGLEELVEQLQALLDRVVVVVEEFPEEQASSSVASTAIQGSSSTPLRAAGTTTTATTTTPTAPVSRSSSSWLGLPAALFKVFVTDVLGIPPLICRGQIDIDNADLRYAAWQCLRTPFNHAKQQRLYRQYESKIGHQWKKALSAASKQHKHDNPSVLVGLSVRTLLDLYLRVKQYSAGSEVVISPPMNVPGILQVFKHHQLKTVAVDLPDTGGGGVVVAVDCDAIEKAVNSKTVAIMVVHVFGMITANDEDMKRIREIATRDGRTIDVIEDCAEAFAGIGGPKSGSYLGSPHADMSLYSFGLIKTTTALSGGVAIVRAGKQQGSKSNTTTVEEMTRLHNSSCYELQQTNREFLWKVFKCSLLRLIADSPVLYGLVFFLVSRVLGLDFDRLVTSLLRGFRLDENSNKRLSASGAAMEAPNSLICQIRRRPSPAMLALLHRRLCQSTPHAESVKNRVEQCRMLSKVLSSREHNDGSLSATIPTAREGSPNYFWLFPVLVDDPVSVSKHLRRRGFDATKGATQLCCVAVKQDECPRATRLMDGVLYLPLERCSSSGQGAVAHGSLVRMAESLDSFPKTSADGSSPRAKKRSGGVTSAMMILLALLLVVSFSVLPRWLVTRMILSGLQLSCCLAILITVTLWALRWSMGDYYVQSSKGFAKYNYLLEERSADQRIDGATSSEEHKSTPGVLSAMSMLKVPSVVDGKTEPRSVFLTGGTGFVGSMLLHDLLLHRKALNIDHVLLLCRSKRGRSAKDRIAYALDGEMFAFLSPEEKVSLVEVYEGDATMPYAGISEDDLESIREKHNVSHVFHCAAAVSFTQSIKDAGASNISSSLNVQGLAPRLNKTCVQFVHISTAFVHGGLCGEESDPLPEELYSFGNFDPLEIYKSMCGTQFYAHRAMAELQFPNTYTFSKSVCEHLLVRNDPNTLIIRPCIVGPAVESPYEGWAGKTPSTIVAALCLYLSNQCSLWSFVPERVPCIPVDVLARYIIAKSFCAPVSAVPVSADSPSSKESLPAEDTSSDEGSFEKLSDGSSFTMPRLSSASSSSSQGHRIFTAAWEDESPDSTSFTWSDFVWACGQVGTTMGYYGRASTMFAVLVAGRLVPKLALSNRQFEKLHYWIAQFPFQIAVRVCDAVGVDTRAMKRMQPFLDLPLLFFHFTNNRFHFRSELVAPMELDGQKYLFSCIAAAHHFTRKFKQTVHDGMSFYRIAGSSHHKVSPSIWWALTQPQGNFSVRIVGWLLSKILRACYSEVTVDVASFIPTTVAREDACVVLAPTHRSFFDFLLLSYLSFVLPELQLSVPLIAAADEFERLPFIGWIIQYLGAFFIRRGRIARDPALFETIASVKKQSGGTGTIEVFVEGTRSRDRRFVEPKTGVLRCLHGAGGSYVIVPISISYERIAEQAVLTNETENGFRHNLSVSSMMDWLMRTFKGHVHLGRAHISACEPLHLSEDSVPDWALFGQTMQQSQADRMLISDYHVVAAARVLGLETEVVKKALSKLGVRFFPSSQALTGPSSSSLEAPVNDCESLSLLFQAAPYISPLFRSTMPAWSEWLSRPTCCEATDEVVNDPSVKLVTVALLRLFDSADRCVEAAVSQLNQKGFSQPKRRHVLQESLRNEIRVPASLLRASISMRVPDIEPSISTSGSSTKDVIVKTTARKRVGSEECLGYWGFHDSAFVVRADKNGLPFVSMDGSRYALRDKKITKLLAFIESETKVKIDPLREAFSERDDALPVCSFCQLSEKDIKLLKSAVSTVSTSDEDRIRHGTGHCQEDVFAIRSGEPIRVPDAVAWPATEDEVADVVAMAQKNQWCIVPFGGGTNVTQATRCPSIEVEPRPIISLDMRRMDKIRWINEENGVAHVEAGVTGRRLEEELSRRGYTMGHEPDSIEFSTLGGWIATKASGMKRNKYGNIEDIVMSVQVAGSNGLLRHGRDDSHVWGRESCGLDLRSLIIGSEGCLGVVTSAVVRIWPIVEAKDYDSILLPDFEEGLRFVREVSKLGANLPASIRLLDNEHFRLGIALRPDSSSQVAALIKTGVSTFVKWKNGLEVKRVVCATIMYEGTRKEVNVQKQAVNQIGARHGGIRLGSDTGKSGYELTFMIAYIRDFAMTYHFLGESFETFVPWSKIEAVIDNTKARIRKEHASRYLPGEPFIGCRVTQLYHEGACLYFYFCMNFENVDSASSIYSEIEHAARAEVIANGGSVSHHHGIGKVRSTFLKEVDSLPLQDAMKSLKNGIDPDNVFGARNGSFASS